MLLCLRLLSGTLVCDMSVAVRKKSWEDHVSQWIGLSSGCDKLCCHGIKVDKLRSAMEEHGNEDIKETPSLPESDYLEDCNDFLEVGEHLPKEIDKNDNLDAKDCCTSSNTGMETTGFLPSSELMMKNEDLVQSQDGINSTVKTLLEEDISNTLEDTNTSDDVEEDKCTEVEGGDTNHENKGVKVSVLDGMSFDEMLYGNSDLEEIDMSGEQLLHSARIAQQRRKSDGSKVVCEQNICSVMSIDPSDSLHFCVSSHLEPKECNRGSQNASPVCRGIESHKESHIEENGDFNVQRDGLEEIRTTNCAQPILTKDNMSTCEGISDQVRLRRKKKFRQGRDPSRLDSMVLLIMKLDQLDQDIDNALSSPPLSRKQVFSQRYLQTTQVTRFSSENAQDISSLCLPHNNISQVQTVDYASSAQVLACGAKPKTSAYNSYQRRRGHLKNRSCATTSPKRGSNLKVQDNSHMVSNALKDQLQIINLSSRILSVADISLLQKGLSFVPTNKFGEFEWIKDIALFTRKLRWRKFWSVKNRRKCQELGIPTSEIQVVELLEDLEREGTKNPGDGPFTGLKKKNTGINPSVDSAIIDIFEAMVVEDLKKMKDMRRRGYNNNLTNEEMRSLRSLEDDRNIIIKASDKGGNIVVMDRNVYIEMCHKILKDQSNYEILPSDPTVEYIAELKEILTKAKDDHLIDAREFQFLCPEHPQIATFYGLPKVHKGLSPLKGRPIVSGVDSLTQGVSQYLDIILRPFVEALPAYLRDTTDLLSRFDGLFVTPNTKLATLDVESLYGSIQHKRGLEAMSFFLNQRSTQFQNHNELLLGLMSFVLERNYFLFNGKYFHQLRGTAMGSPCAPTYANLYLGWWEEKSVFNEENCLWTSCIDMWVRFIDDVFVLWTGEIEHFNQFVQHLNNNDMGLFLTAEISHNHSTFLDVNITKTTENTLETTIFRKKTSTNTLLHWQSYHPTSLKKGIPKGQLIRARRNCSGEGDFRKEMKDMIKRFDDRGYPQEVTEKAKEFVDKTPREEFLKVKKKKENDGKVRIIGSYDNRAKEIRGLISKYWHILKRDPDLKDCIADEPLLTYRRGRNIRDRLVHSHLEPSIPSLLDWIPANPLIGFFLCPGCLLCKYMRRGSKFKSSSTGKEYNIRNFINCQSKDLIYLAQCSCPKDYIGKTRQQLRRRVGQHIGNITRGEHTSVASHMRDVHNNDLSQIKFMGIEIMRDRGRQGDIDRRLLQKETGWIHRIDSCSPRGLNETLSFAAFS